MLRVSLALVLLLSILWKSIDFAAGSNFTADDEEWYEATTLLGGDPDAFLSRWQRQLAAPVSYKLLSSQEIHRRLLSWKGNADYNDLVRVTTAQADYKLARAGGSQDCPFEIGNGCSNYIVTLQDFIAHPANSESSKRLPEVLLSGELHGNERVGPTAVVETAELLLAAAVCESRPRSNLQGTNRWQAELDAAEACRVNLRQRYKLTDTDRQWLGRLMSTRRIVVVPTANALGYYRNVREEGTLDPNRDFPYDLTDRRTCMRTIAGRTLNELFRGHMFQLSLIFHGGMEAIGYEWGSMTWKSNYISPDDTAQKHIASAYSEFGGGWSSSKKYHFGPSNKLVYPIRGGMEDWAYAGSWDTDRVIQCEPTTYNGYPKAKTVYSQSMLRAFNMLVECSNDKVPWYNLGSSDNVLNPTSGPGHVPRNIRLSLLAVEAVEPYVALNTVNGLRLSDDVVPLTSRSGKSCMGTKAVAVPFNSSDKVTLTWTVGGAFTVDDTKLYYARWSDIPEGKLDCISQPSIAELGNILNRGSAIGVTKGKTRFAGGFSATSFSASFDISGFNQGDKIVVFAAAKVDQSWAIRPGNAVPRKNPQSHIARARTDPDWLHESDTSIIQGRLYWTSIPVTIHIQGNSGPQTSSVVELFNRFEDSHCELEVANFALIDSKKNKKITSTLPTYIKYHQLYEKRLNIQAEPSSSCSGGKTIRSIRWTLAGGKSRCDSTAPFSAFGDRNGNFKQKVFPIGGPYSISAVPYENTNCEGQAGKSKEQVFYAVGQRKFQKCPGAAVYLQLVNADTGQVVGPITKASTICKPAYNISIRAQVVNCSTQRVNSVKFNLSGTKTHSATSNGPHYLLFGGSLVRRGSIPGNQLPPGKYELTSTPYAQKDGEGTVGGKLRISFTISTTACTR